MGKKSNFRKFLSALKFCNFRGVLMVTTSTLKTESSPISPFDWRSFVMAHDGVHCHVRHQSEEGGNWSILGVVGQDEANQIVGVKFLPQRETYYTYQWHIRYNLHRIGYKRYYSLWQGHSLIADSNLDFIVRCTHTES